MNNILIIDDEKAICSSLSFALENEYNVFVAQTPEEALKCYFNSNIDIVLLDLKLGEYNGMDVLKRIRESNKEAVVIIMTAYRHHKIIGRSHESRSISLYNQTHRY